MPQSSGIFATLGPIEAFEKIVALYNDKKEREGWTKPYLTQHFAVFIILNNQHESPEVCLAGFFHNVLSDLPRYSYAQLVRDTNISIAQLVKEVSEKKSIDGVNDKKANWGKRKQDILDRFSRMSQSAQKIFVAINIYYLKSLIDCYYEEGDSIWPKLNAPKEKMAWYYQELSLRLTTYFQHPMVGDYFYYLDKANQLFRW